MERKKVHEKYFILTLNYSDNQEQMIYKKTQDITTNTVIIYRQFFVLLPRVGPCNPHRARPPVGGWGIPTDMLGRSENQVRIRGPTGSPEFGGFIIAGPPFLQGS
jgi:hypothetical protein